MKDNEEHVARCVWIVSPIIAHQRDSREVFCVACCQGCNVNTQGYIGFVVVSTIL